MIVGCRETQDFSARPRQLEGTQPYKDAALNGQQSGKGTREIIIRFATTINPALDNEKGPSSLIQDLKKSRSLRSAQCNVVRSLGCSAAGACVAAAADEAQSKDRHPEGHQHARVRNKQPQQPLSGLYIL